MNNYYLEGEERFGRVSSRLYAFFSGLPEMRSFYAYVINDLEASGAKRILDIGSGTGSIMLGLEAKRPGLALYAVEPSREMLGIARRRSHGLVHFAQGSSRHVPFRGRFDMIFSTLSFHHWKRQRESLGYLAGLLADSGEIRIYEVDKGRAGFFLRLAAGSHSVSADGIRRTIPGALRLSSYSNFGRFARIVMKRRRLH